MLNLFDSQLRRYKRIREQSVPCMTQAATGLPKELLLQAARDLRLLGKDDKTFVMDDEQEFDFILDRAIHDIPWPHKRWVEQIFERCQTDNNPDKAILEAHIKPIFSLYAILKISPGRGARLVDLFSQEEIFLMDVGLGATAKPGFLLATRVVTLEEIHFTSGVSMVYEAREKQKLADNFMHLHKEKKGAMSWEQMMRKYSPYFFREFKKSRHEILLAPVADNLALRARGLRSPVEE